MSYLYSYDNLYSYDSYVSDPPHIADVNNTIKLCLPKTQSCLCSHLGEECLREDVFSLVTVLPKYKG